MQLCCRRMLQLLQPFFFSPYPFDCENLKNLLSRPVLKCQVKSKHKRLKFLTGENFSLSTLTYPPSPTPHTLKTYNNENSFNLLYFSLRAAGNSLRQIDLYLIALVCPNAWFPKVVRIYRFLLLSLSRIPTKLISNQAGIANFKHEQIITALAKPEFLEV